MILELWRAKCCVDLVSFLIAGITLTELNAVGKRFIIQKGVVMVLLRYSFIVVAPWS